MQPDCPQPAIIRRVKITLICLGIAGAWYGLHRLAVWAKHRGWIFYRTKRGPLGSYGMALIQATTPFAPEVEHVIEEQQAEEMRAEATESGAAPPPDLSSDTEDGTVT
jgi:hypothetical protein